MRPSSAALGPLLLLSLGRRCLGTNELDEGGVTPSSPVDNFTDPSGYSTTPGEILQLPDLAFKNNSNSSAFADVISPPEESSEQPSSSPTEQDIFASIGLGRYMFSSDEVALHYSSFSLDIKAMILAESIEEAEEVYREGRHALSNDASHQDSMISISSFSREAEKYMSQDPMFNIFKYALYDDDSLENKHGLGFTYADEVVEEALAAEDTELAAEAAVVLNVWMMISHMLSNAIDTCRKGENPISHIDAGVALWIGREQVAGSFTSNRGWSLYALAQTAHRRFGFSEGEAPVNSALFESFLRLKEQSEGCVDITDTYLDLRFEISNTLRQLSIPLVQHLLSYIADDDRWHVELYAVAILSQLAATDPIAYMELSDVLFTDFSRQQVTQHVVDDLVAFFRDVRITCQDLSLGTAAEDFYLSVLVEKICEGLAEVDADSSLRTYEPTSNVTEEARIDLDIFQIKLFSKTKAFSAALDYFNHGYNILDKDSKSGFLSLGTLSSLPVESGSLWSVGNGGDDPSEVITDALEGIGRFTGASKYFIAEVVSRTLQSRVAFEAVLAEMSTAIRQCQVFGSDNDDAMASWDRAVAYFLGAASYSAVTDKSSSSNTMFSLGEELCAVFDTCTLSGESSNNVKLVEFLRKGKDLLENGKCSDAESLVSSQFIPHLFIPIAQGFIQSLSQKKRLEESVADRLVFGAAISSALASLDGNENRKTLPSEIFDFAMTSLPTLDGMKSSIEVVHTVMNLLGIDCDDIGRFHEDNQISFCFEEGEGPSDHDIWSLYGPSRMDIGMDIHDMRNALMNGQVEIARSIYRDGLHSKVFDAEGMFLRARSIQSFSTEKTSLMEDEVPFNLFVLGNTAATPFSIHSSDEHHQKQMYGDVFVKGLLNDKELGDDKTIAADAALVLNVWMYTVHLLYDSLKQCKGENQSDRGRIIDTLAEARAYWIGDSQTDGLRAEGNLMYAFTQEIGKHFSKEIESKKLQTNGEILGLIDEVRDLLSSPNGCSGPRNSIAKSQLLVSRITEYMAVPLFQALIHNIYVDDRARVRLYAASVLPFVASCRPAVYSRLNEKLTGSSYSVGDSQDIVKELRNCLPCLHLKCSDVGVHTFEAGLTRSEVCQITKTSRFDKSYKPVDVTSKGYGHIDQDVLEIDRLLEGGAFEAAKDIYLYGKYARVSSSADQELLSLSTLTDLESAKSTEMQMFRNYYHTGDDSTDGDILLLDSAFDSYNVGFAEVDRRAIIKPALSAEALHFIALEAVNDAVVQCDDTSTSGQSVETWDIVAAHVIGSLDPEDLTGHSFGYSHVALAEEVCESFGVCSEENGALVNDRILTVLQRGRDAAVNKSCEVLDSHATELRSLLLVPFIQRILQSSIDVSHSSSRRTANANGYVFSRTILPLLDADHRSVANVLKASFDLQATRSAKAVGRQVFIALSQVYDTLGIDCQLVGIYEGIDTCSPSFSYLSESEKSRYLTILLWASIGVLALLTAIFIVRAQVLKNREESLGDRKSDAPETQDFFAPRLFTPRSASGGIKRRNLSRLRGPERQDVENRSSNGWGTIRQDAEVTTDFSTSC